jgi:imidazole glycerol-phosphate synthase subunit HisH
MQKVCILDYGSGNVASVFNLLSFLKVNVIVSNSKKEIVNCSHLILPGVGSFAKSMKKIKANIPIDILEKEVLIKKKPFLGICVGMQVLAEHGLEFGETKGLGWISGIVEKLNSKEEPLPHIGWNEINIINHSKIVEGLDKVRDFYFVNSFVFKSKNKSRIVATTNYGEAFVSIIKKNNIIGVQFHPEKSQKSGLKLISNFLKY